MMPIRIAIMAALVAVLQANGVYAQGSDAGVPKDASPSADAAAAGDASVPDDASVSGDPSGDAKVPGDASVFRDASASSDASAAQDASRAKPAVRDAGAADAAPGDAGIESLGEGAFVLKEDDLEGQGREAGAATKSRKGDGRSALPEDESLYQLREVVVTRDRRDLFRVGGSAHLVDQETLETYENDDVHQIVLQVPGVYVRGEDGYGLRPNIGIRGASAERSKKITLMEDGVPLAPAPYSAPAAYYFPISTRMVGMEVLKGPSTIRHGPHTVGGSIDLRTRDVPSPGEQKAGIDVAGGSNLYGKVHGHYGIAGEHFGALLEGVALHSNGFKNLDGGGDTGFSKQEVMLKLRANTDPSDYVYHSVQLKLGYSHELSNETYLGLTDEDFAQTPNRRYAASRHARFEWDRAQIQLDYKAQIGDDIDIVVTGYRNDFWRTWRKLNRFRTSDPDLTLNNILRNPDTGQRAVFYDVLRGAAESSRTDERQTLMIGSNARSFASQGIQTRGRVRFETGDWKHQLELGLRYHNDRVDRFHTENGYFMRLEDDQPRLVEDERDRITTLDQRGETHAFAAHLMYGLTFRGLTLKPGLRTEHIFNELTNEPATGQDEESTRCTDGCESRQHVVLPGLGAHYAITDDLGVLAGVHKGFSPRAPGQRDEVEPEESINYEWGLRYQTEASQVEAIGFFNDYQNLLGECRISAGCTDRRVGMQSNVGEVHVFGAELLAAHTFSFGQWRIPTRLTYTFTDSEFQNNFSSSNPQFGDVSKGDELPYVPHHQAGMRAGVAMGDRWDAHVSATYVGAMRETAGPRLPYRFIVDRDPQLTDDYVLLDLVGRVRVYRQLRTYLKLNNVLQARAIASRRPFGARPIPPFRVQIGVKYDWGP